MKFKKDHRIAPFIKDILILEDERNMEHRLPFYADGYPGIIFARTENDVVLMPSNRILSEFYLYGQTIEPIEMITNGPYKMVLFQLYPFATRLLLGVDPHTLNDDCFDLKKIQNVNTIETIANLRTSNTDEQIGIISDYILELVKYSSTSYDNVIKLAVSTIINSKGTIPVHKLREQLYITERTFERKFAREIGVTPKQFAKITQFSFSLNQIQESDYTRLTNVAYDNNFTDQSHFIRTFKKYTGHTPKEILERLE
jgi:AraC-like DNA-binding protein